MSIKTGCIVGAIVGAAIAALLISLVHIRPFSPDLNAAVESITFRLCPLYVLGFSSAVKSEASLIIITVLGNAVLYSAVFGVIVLIVSRIKGAIA